MSKLKKTIDNLKIKLYLKATRYAIKWLEENGKGPTMPNNDQNDNHDSDCNSKCSQTDNSSNSPDAFGGNTQRKVSAMPASDNNTITFTFPSTDHEDFRKAADVLESLGNSSDVTTIDLLTALREEVGDADSDASRARFARIMIAASSIESLMRCEQHDVQNGFAGNADPFAVPKTPTIH